MHRLLRTLSTGLLSVALHTPAHAEDPARVPTDKITKSGHYLTALEAAEMLRDSGVIFLDVRSRAEVAFLGIPERVNVHIPYLMLPAPANYDPTRLSYPMVFNPDFEIAFLDYADAAMIEDDTPIVVMCRSGTRSAKAADALFDLGYSNVYSIVDGYEGDLATDGPERGHPVVNGWKNAGLQWSYGISPGQAYPEDLH
ncbi:sulfurtransferase [Sinirhodobacter sp. WL0062]|uniref:Sulfurtransferase n=1 Tax=Rhodobacter flavimaris TaxID=2907145 RepID=A0ABS8YVJ2_9RHOB|nr:rhodanese-like domain-containing protein [Sinirhodobacter sp. WL0062]MCE5973861.1 sulfurtransferase [Sinirhodobacter sp. WL0062]